jgi:putative transposase
MGVYMLYRRAAAAGGTYFFTVNLADRNADTLVRCIDGLRTATNKVKQKHPFSILAMVVLPEHLHVIWRLPQGDIDYPLRWSLIKAGFSRRVEQGERISRMPGDKTRTRPLATAILGASDSG